MGLDNFINLNLMKNPVNWGIVLLMWMLGAMLMAYIASSWNQSSGSQ